MFGFEDPADPLNPLMVENAGTGDGWMVLANFISVFVLGELHTHTKNVEFMYIMNKVCRS